MSIEKDIPSIYASIGDREDVLPSRTVHVVESVLRSEAANKYHGLLKEGFTFEKEAREYVAHLEIALREALSDKFLADRMRDLANDSVVMDGRGEIWADILRLVANRLAPASM